MSKGWIDEDRIGCMGWSQGGYISAFLTTSSSRFAAICVGAGISNWVPTAQQPSPWAAAKRLSDAHSALRTGDILLQHGHHAVLPELPRRHPGGRQADLRAHIPDDPHPRGLHTHAHPACKAALRSRAVALSVSPILNASPLRGSSIGASRSPTATSCGKGSWTWAYTRRWRSTPATGTGLINPDRSARSWLTTGFGLATTFSASRRPPSRCWAAHRTLHKRGYERGCWLVGTLHLLFRVYIWSKHHKNLRFSCRANAASDAMPLDSCTSL